MWSDLRRRIDFATGLVLLVLANQLDGLAATVAIVTALLYMVPVVWHEFVGARRSKKREATDA